MAYCSTTEVTADFKDIAFTTTSNIKSADVDQFIVEADALINSFIGSRYVVPVVSGAGLNLLKLYSRSLVTARIKKIMEVKQAKSDDANQNVVGVFLSPKDVMQMLKDIRESKINLDGCPLLNSNSGFYSNNVSNKVCSVMKKDLKQW